MPKKLTDKEREFLIESNKIEREYSDEALEDAIKAWKFAKLYMEGSGKINKDLILTTHMLLMKNLNPDIAGRIREIPVRIGNDYKKQSKKDIEINLSLWVATCLDCTTEKQIEQSHIIFEKIHPFEDGNGRTGRILMNLQRIKAGLPILVIKEKSKFEYYKWFTRVEND